MSFIFMDESGDLGFDFKKSRTTKYFLITFLFSKDKRSLDKIIKKVFKGFSKKLINKHCGVLHCHDENSKTRMKLLTHFGQLDNVDVMTIYLNKKKVYTNLRDEKNVLYNYVVNILLDRIYTKGLVSKSENLSFIASKRETNKFLNVNFKNYLENQLTINHKANIKIEIKTPAQEKGLQIVDFLSWSIFRKYEYDDASYYNIIHEKIIEERGLFG